MGAPRILPALLLAAALAPAAPAQPLPAPPPWGLAPLLYVRFSGPAGARVTLYQGPGPGRTFPVPFVAGLRPGYIYRIKVTGFRSDPEAVLFPSLEVRGTLTLPPQLRAAAYPVPVAFREEDVGPIRAGAVVTSVLALEDPEQAYPLPAVPGQPVEIDTAPREDPLAMARERGRPLLVVRTGQRELSPEEVARQAIPGTVLLPGDRVLPPPAARPWLPWACFPPYDPRMGPRPPGEECLHDGGDTGLPAGIDREGRLQGLDPSDTVAEYTDVYGRRRVACSNRICLCVPRYLLVRNVIGVAGFTTLIGPGATQGAFGQVLVRSRVPSLQAQGFEGPEMLAGQQRPSGTRNVVGPEGLFRLEMLNAVRMEIGPEVFLGTKQLIRLTQLQQLRLKRQIELALEFSRPIRLAGVDQVVVGPAVIGRVKGVNVVATVQTTRDFTVSCKEPICPPPDKPLLLHKWADRQAAQVGDVVTFFLKYTNLGGQPISDVAVSDSLTARLEYIPGSARSDRDAVFTIQGNEAGSSILRWEVGSRLLPGQSGIVSFQARVR